MRKWLWILLLAVPLLMEGCRKQQQVDESGYRIWYINQDETCLKYENDQISFDFDNPGEAPPKEAAAAEETTALEETEESERKTISNHEN